MKTNELKDNRREQGQRIEHRSRAFLEKGCIIGEPEACRISSECGLIVGSVFAQRTRRKAMTGRDSKKESRIGCSAQQVDH